MEPARKVRLSLELTEDLNRELDQVAAQFGETKSDVLRKAVALMLVAADAKRKGLKIGLADPDQPLRTEFVGL